MLPQTGRATPCVRKKSCQLLHNSVGTSRTTNPQRIEVTELEHYVRPTWYKLCASSHDALDRRRVLLITPSTCRAEFFYVQSLGKSSRRKYSYFWTYPNFLTTQFRIGRRKLQRQNAALSGLWRTDRQTHDDSICRASLTWRGKKVTASGVSMQGAYGA